MIWNLGMGAACAVLFARLVQSFADEETAFRAVLIWMCWPTALVCTRRIGNRRSWHSRWIAAGDAKRARDALAAALLIGASLSRGFVLPLSAAAFVHVFWPSSRRPVEDTRVAPRTRERWLLVTAAAAGPFIWPAIAAAVTGRADAIVATQAAWGVSPVPRMLVAAWRDGWDRDGWPLLITSSSLAAALTIASAAAIALTASVPCTLKAYAASRRRSSPCSRNRVPSPSGPFRDSRSRRSHRLSRPPWCRFAVGSSGRSSWR